MALLRVILVLNAIAMSVVSFPSVRNVELQKEQITDQNLQETHQPIAPLAENYDSKQKSSIVEFVKNSHKENSTVMQGTDNEKYTITNIPTKMINSKDIETGSDLTKRDFSDIENSNIKSSTNSNSPSTLEKEEKSGIFTYEDTWSLSPKESSAITEGTPKYFFGIIEANPPFPDISRRRNIENKFNLKEKWENVTPFLMSRKINHPYSVGPALYPESIYNKEFAIPFFE